MKQQDRESTQYVPPEAGVLQVMVEAGYVSSGYIPPSPSGGSSSGGGSGDSDGGGFTAPDWTVISEYDG